MKNDILTAVDHGKAVMLILLDLSAAFDTIDHDTLLNLMKTRLGISGSALDWVRSYLSYRTQVVSISEARSEVVCLIFGVPQGSVLGPMLFTLYILPIGDIARKNNVDFHGYADDTQLYVTFKSTNSEETKLSIDRAEACIHSIRVWMKHHKLKLNDDKTEVVIIASPHQQRLTGMHSIPRITIGDTRVCPSPSARNLGCNA